MADNALRRRNVQGDSTTNETNSIAVTSTNDEDTKKQAPSAQQTKPVSKRMPTDCIQVANHVSSSVHILATSCGFCRVIAMSSLQFF
jgi:hypothetical protein